MRVEAQEVVEAYRDMEDFRHRMISSQMPLDEIVAETTARTKRIADAIDALEKRL